MSPPKPINLLKNEYKLVGKLGTGGFSLVYSVESVETGVMCAAKFQVKKLHVWTLYLAISRPP